MLERDVSRFTDVVPEIVERQVDLGIVVTSGECRRGRPAPRAESGRNEAGVACSGRVVRLKARFPVVEEERPLVPLGASDTALASIPGKRPSPTVGIDLKKGTTIPKISPSGSSLSRRMDDWKRTSPVPRLWSDQGREEDHVQDENFERRGRRATRSKDPPAPSPKRGRLAACRSAYSSSPFDLSRKRAPLSVRDSESFRSWQLYSYQFHWAARMGRRTVNGAM